jgi:PadR family transcriptional regulator PadR
MENKIKQLRKGILELVILNTLANDRHYGYSLIRTISKNHPLSITEGTIYPILGRLTKEGLVNGEWMESRQGPPRKYYSLSPKGREIRKILSEEFESLIALYKNSKSKTPLRKTAKKINVKKRR